MGAPFYSRVFPALFRSAHRFLIIEARRFRAAALIRRTPRRRFGVTPELDPAGFPRRPGGPLKAAIARSRRSRSVLN